jgi:TMEM175 potassium channel family protein
VGKTRLEAFSDGVIAIIITIMVLELRAPHGTDLDALRELTPKFLTYVLSFIYLGIYWNNHHHLLHTVTTVTGGILWANLHLLFWLTLVPFATGWMGENHFAPLPTALYGVVLFFAGFAYYVLVNVIIAAQGSRSKLAAAVGRDFKGKISIVIYLVGILFAFVSTAIAETLYVFVAMMWLVPDRRIERRTGDDLTGRTGD